MSDRIGVLSAGMVSAGGKTLAETWDFVNGDIGSLVTLPYHLGTTQRRAKVANLMALEYTGIKKIGERLFDIAVMAADQAVGVGNLDGICIGSTTDSYAAQEHGLPLENPLVVFLADRYRIPFHRFQFSNACASSSTAIAAGMDLIRSGRANTVLVGGADEVLASCIAAFDAVRIYGDECRPFDINRKGLTLGEGAAFFVLAKEGIGEPIAYLNGAGLTCDAKDEAAMDPYAIADAMVLAFIEAGDEKRDLGFICAHGTGTKANDEAEAWAIRLVYHHNVTPPVVSYKGALGHPQGASGAFGLALTIESLRRQTIFANFGILQDDPALHLFVPGTPVEAKMKSAMVLSHGTWGVDTALHVSLP